MIIKQHSASRAGAWLKNTVNSGHYLLSANLKHKCSLHKTLGPIMVARHKNGGPRSWVCARLTLRSSPIEHFMINFLAISGDSKRFLSV